MRLNPVGYFKRFLKPYSRAVSVKYRGFRHRLDTRPETWSMRKANKVLDYFDLYFVDHHIFRAIYPNRHEIAPGVWRASQPSPGQIAYYARRGIRTIINLRGERDCGSYRLQREACRKQNITLVNFMLRSRNAPSADAIRQAQELLETAEYPILIHCKSGADRAGLMSALAMHLREGKPIKKAKRQLHLKYGHFKQSDTGVLDFFFERYLRDRETAQISFFEWLEEHYNPNELAKEFRAKGWANFLVNWALRRE